MSDGVKISYNAAVTRIRCEFTKAMTLATEQPPESVIARARAKMEAVKASGQVGFFVVYETRFKDSWTALRQAETAAAEQQVALTLAAGAPMLDGLLVAPEASDKGLIAITIDPAAERSEAWKWDWFRLCVQRRMRELGIKDRPNNAQLYSAFARAKGNQPVDGQLVGLNPLPSAEQKAFSVVGNKQRKEIGVVIRNVAELRDQGKRDHMLQLINQAVRQMNSDGVEFRVLKKDFLAAIQSSLDGPEGLGLELPLSLLAAYGVAKESAGGQPKLYGQGPIKFLVSHDRMEVTLTGFELATYDDLGKGLDVALIKSELLKHKITRPMGEDLEKALALALKNEADLNGLVVCRGLIGEGGKEPYLHPVYKDTAPLDAVQLEQATLNLRGLQQRCTVRKDQVVARIEHRIAGVPPRDVFDQELSMPLGEPLDVAVGDGVVKRGDYEFVATLDGLPVLTEVAVSLSQSYVHQGDVNLSTGDIVFDGPVEINGNVEAGALVATSGSLIVRGSVTAARLLVKGDLTVEAGISTGQRGLVEVRGSVTAQFVEQSTIICRGDLTVQKALLNSQVYVSGAVHVGGAGGAGGVLAGGKLYSLSSLTTGCLGTARGSVTVVSVGVDWQVARLIEIKQRRLEQLKKRSQEDKLALRDIVQKKPGQATARHLQLRDTLQKRLPRLRLLIERLEAQLTHATGTLTYGSLARIQVRETLFTNVHATVCGQVIAISNDVMEVSLQPKRVRGSFIVPLEEADASKKVS